METDREKSINQKYGFLLGVMWNIKNLAVKDNHIEILEQIERAYDFTEHTYLKVNPKE